jgi:hypothetical protein
VAHLDRVAAVIAGMTVSWLLLTVLAVATTKLHTTTAAGSAAGVSSLLGGAQGVPLPVVRALDLDAPPLLPPSDRRIWAFWEGSTIPEVVSFAARSWEAFNPGVEVRLLNFSSPFFPWEILPNLTVKIGIAGQTDLLRVHLLAKYGGMWVDASDIITGPGLFDALGNLTRQVVMKGQPVGPDVERSACSWFICAREARLPLLVHWRQLLVDYLFRVRAEPITEGPMAGSGKLKVQALLDAGVAQAHIGYNVTAQAALDDLERSGKWPYFFAHYLLNQVSRGRERRRTMGGHGARRGR